MRTCTACGIEIPAERLEALPNTTTCTTHSNVIPTIGVTEFTAGKGCGGETQLLRTTNKETIRLWQRGNKRGR